MNFYVTRFGIKGDHNLFGSEYEFKVYFNEGLYVEDSKGKKIEKPEPKKKVSSKVRNIPTDKDDKNAE